MTILNDLKAVVGETQVLAGLDAAAYGKDWLGQYDWTPLCVVRPANRDEVADVLLYLIQLAGALGIDPVAAAQAKLKRNAQRYPVDRARGSSAKHDQL